MVLTGLEADILQSIEHAGWHAHLWFPVVERKLLNFGSDVPDQEVHAAVVALVRKGTLVHADPEGWRPPNFSPAPDIRGQILPSPGYMLLVHRMPSVPPGPVEAVLEAEIRTNQIGAAMSTTKRDVEQANGENFIFSELEAQILRSIDHVGWYPYLWFPVVAREMLNFGSDEREENVHAAILGLIQKGGLVATREEPGDNPQWSPAPGTLVAAERTMREVRALQPPPWPDRFSERFHIFASMSTISGRRHVHSRIGLDLQAGAYRLLRGAISSTDVAGSRYWDSAAILRHDRRPRNRDLWSSGMIVAKAPHVAFAI